MALFRIKLSDGTTTINLYDGSDAKILEGGMQLPPPNVNVELIENTFADGVRLARHNYTSRTLTLKTKIWGSSLADLKANIRAINRLLSDARERTLLGQGAQVYLEYQWGDTDGQSAYYDVLFGALAMPDSLHTAVLPNSYYVLDAMLTLTCKPFGRYANTTLGAATIYNGNGSYNAQDIYTSTNGATALVNLDATTDYGASIFRAAANYTCIGAAIKVAKVGSPTGIKVKLWTIAGGEPDTMLKSVDIDAADVSSDISSAPLLRAIFASGQALTSGTNYAIVIYASGTCDGANYLKLYGTTTFVANCTLAFSSDSGVNWNVYAGTHSFTCATLIAATAETNYQDIDVSASTPEPDVPSPMYLKLTPTGATGTKKMWVGKRSGSRKSDDLWTEGESFTSFTKVGVSGTLTTVGGGRGLLNGSGGLAGDMYIIDSGANIAAGTAVARWNYSLANLPYGHFRVLARVMASDVSQTGFGVGYSYGGTTKTPSHAGGEFFQAAADSTYEVVDIGEIIIPPISDSDIATEATLELRVFVEAYAQMNSATAYHAAIDWLFLLPIDEGCIIADDIVSTDVLASDGISDPQNVLVLDGSDVIQRIPDYVGLPLTYGREDFRLYVIRDDVAVGVTFSSVITYQGLLLVV